jgi:cytochrome b subunit of formate dehydrogenase/nitrate/TMAO reductase-like tetraheme cytochrome c subunit
MVKATSPESPLHRMHLAATCGRCHEKAAKEVATSVHGKALAAGVRDAPTCTDCHAEHRITSLVTASAMTISEDVCSRCHASERLATKYNMPADRFRTFFDSYHGLAARLGSTRAANCASCHGWHAVLPSADPASTIHKSNLAKTCGSCHPGIGTRLAKAEIKIHSEPGAAEGKPWIVNFIARFYILIIAIVIGAMLAHNGIDYIAKTRVHMAHIRLNGEDRLSRLARVQHFTLIILFVLLAYTGFVHKYPDAIWSWPFQIMPGGNYVRGMIHRIAGWLFTILLVAHCIGLAVTRGGRAEARDLMLRPKDWRDLWGTLAFNLRLRSTPPPRDRFNYVEKSEYWALMWGSVVMIITGIALIFTEPVLRILPKVWLDISQVVHYYEAVLATLAIIVWHFYGVIFDPECYPMNPAWLIGKRPKPPTEHKPPGTGDPAKPALDHLPKIDATKDGATSAPPRPPGPTHNRAS